MSGGLGVIRLNGLQRWQRKGRIPGTGLRALEMSSTQDSQCMGTAKVSWKGGISLSANPILFGGFGTVSRRSGLVLLKWCIANAAEVVVAAVKATVLK